MHTRTFQEGGGGGGDTITNDHVIGSGPFHVAPDGPIERGAQEQSGRWNRLSHADMSHQLLFFRFGLWSTPVESTVHTKKF